MLKKIILISLVVFLVAMAAVTSLVLWGIANNYYDSEFPIDPFLINWTRTGSERLAPFEETLEFSLNDVEDLIILKTWGTLEIRTTPGDGGMIKLDGRLPETMTISPELRYGEKSLEIRLQPDTERWGNRLANGRLDILLLLPDRLYRQISVDSALGNLYTEGIRSDNIRIDSAMGNVDLHGTFRELDLSYTMGNLSLRGSVDRLTAEGNMGNVNLDIDSFQELAIRQTMGNITLRIPKDRYAAHFYVKATMGTEDVSPSLLGAEDLTPAHLQAEFGNITIKEVLTNE